MYVWDPFAFAAVGSSIPSGWGFPLGGSGTVRAFTDRGAFSPHNWFEFNSQELTSPAFATADTGITAWFAYRNNGFANSGPIFQAWSPSTVPGSPIRVVNMRIENDGTISLDIGGSPDVFFANTGNNAAVTALQCNVWYYFQVNIQLDFVLVGSDNFLRAKVDVVLDGQLVLTGATGISNFYIDHSFPGDNQAMTFVSWSRANSNTGLAETYVSNYLGAGAIGLPENIWDLVIDTPGSGYGPLAPNIIVSGGDANIGCTIDVGPGSGGTGAVTRIFPIAPNYLGDGYTVAPTLTAVPFGTPNGSGFSGHTLLRPLPFRRVNQMIAEAAKAPINAFVHNSQMVVERAKAPVNSFLRVSQLVIELPFKPTPGNLSSWIVKEC